MAMVVFLIKSVRHSEWSIHMNPNDKHFIAEVDFVRCWGQTHSNDNFICEGWRLRNTWQHWKKRNERPFWIKMALVWVAQPGWAATQALAYTSCAWLHTNSTKVQTHWVNHPTHAKCSHYNACLNHIRLLWWSWVIKKNTTVTSF